MTTAWLKFWAALLPEVIAMVRELYARHAGNAETARAELIAIRDHGLRLREGEKRVDEQLAEARRRELAQTRRDKEP